MEGEKQDINAQQDEKEQLKDTTGDQQEPDEGTSQDSTDTHDGSESGDDTDGTDGAEGEEPEDSGDDKADTETVNPLEQVNDVPQLAALAPTPDPIIPPVKSDRVEALMGYLTEYVEFMNPNNYMDAKKGIPKQRRLYTLLTELNTLDYVEFNEAMGRLLSLVYNHRHAAFSDLYVRRFFEQLYPQMTHAQIHEFDNLIGIIVPVGSAQNRSKALAQIDLNFALGAVTDGKARQNLAAYFSALR